LKTKSFLSLLLVILSLSSAKITFAQTSCNPADTLPFSTNATHLTMWNGEKYVPLFIKGINLGISVPGTFPGELAASRAQYGRWFQLVKEAGFNTIRLYTLHYPHFYEVLDSFNLANPNQPLHFFQGVWLEEELPGYDEDLYFLTSYFDKEIEENVDAVHGNATIATRRGKAFGTYRTDVSRWMLGYIIGREIHPGEVLHTDELHASVKAYEGRFLKISEASPTEAWMVQRLDNLLRWEKDKYNTQRPVSFSSWPTLDPLKHPFEPNDYEDMATIDLSAMDIQHAPAGYFASYHAYPYYPDFISQDPSYTPFKDHYGQNSYLGYLTYLKNHYNKFPLIIAEFGAASSWGIAHYAQNGIHHGGSDEQEQGRFNLRMMQNILTSGCGGGIQFALMDEWFKRTWITDPLDFDPESRIRWHNVAAAEQNFGIIGFKKPNSDLEPWESFCADCPVQAIKASADYTYFNMQLQLSEPLDVLDTLWLALDTYQANLGENRFPNGVPISNRAEFLLMITNNFAELYVTEAYDLFGLWHGVAAPEQKFRSIVSQGAPWKLVRWKNNYTNQEVQYVGTLRVNRLGLPKTSMDAVTIDEEGISIKLPWNLLNFVDPGNAMVMHDDRATSARETIKSDGVAVTFLHKNRMQATDRRFTWDTWYDVSDAVEYKKESFYIAKQYMGNLPGGLIARCDAYEVDINGVTTIAAAQGVLQNDVLMDGSSMEAILVKAPSAGILFLQKDGGFTYIPEEGRTGTVRFTYQLLSGAFVSEPVEVELTLKGLPEGSGFAQVYPNPAINEVTVLSRSVLDRVEVFNIVGALVRVYPIQSTEKTLRLDGLKPGMYLFRLHSAKESMVKKVVVEN
jgi:hypothetical protein